MPGVYYYSLNVDGKITTKKMIAENNLLKLFKKPAS